MQRHALLSVAFVLSAYGAREYANAAPAPAPAHTVAPDVALAPDATSPSAPGGDEPEASKKSDALVRFDPPRTTYYAVTFVNLHTSELLPIEAERELASDELSRFLRCRVTGDTREMAREPFEVARRLASRFDRDRIEIVSGYRSDKLNELLRKKGHEVASKSRHVMGEALDFRVPGVDAVELARAASEIHAGGIGTYRESGFIHVDVGPVRRWRGR